MAANTFHYERGAEHPSLTLPWQEETAPKVWTDLDLSAGYTFTLRLVNAAGTDVVTKTTNLVGADGSVTVNWDTDELDIAETAYTLRLRAREVATSKDRDYRPKDPVQIVIH
jgi:hypothetical protein